MAQPPSTPPSSDLGGVHRDGGKLVGRRKAADADEQDALARGKEQNRARPDYQSDIAAKGNAQ